jgi:hypothetical protein
MKAQHSPRQMKVLGFKERAVTRPTGRREYVHVGLTAAPCRRHLSIEQPHPLRFVYFHGNAKQLSRSRLVFLTLTGFFHPPITLHEFSKGAKKLNH